MNGFRTLLIMNIRLLLRNKGFLAVLIVLPVIAVLMLNINSQSTSAAKEESNKIYDIPTDDTRIFNMASTQLSIKVYDSSQSRLSEYLLQELANTGSYQIYRIKSDPMELTEAREKALASANRNVIGSVIFLPAEFDNEILKGQQSSAAVFTATQDGRNKLLQRNMDSILSSLYHYSAITGYNEEKLISLLDTSVRNEVTKHTVTVEVGDALNLTGQQQNNSSGIGYSLAFLTLAFLFSGIFIAAMVVEERNNRVYNRILLSPSSLIYYGVVKLIITLATVVIETGIVAVVLKLIIRTDFGIPYPSYLFLVFCLGLIFTLFSVVIGVLTNNALTTTYIAFLVWCMSCVLAGLYFPLDANSDWWTKISLLMPQRWGVKASEMLMAGKTDAYSIFTLVMAGYLVIIASVGFLGIKIRKKD